MPLGRVCVSEEGLEEGLDAIARRMGSLGGGRRRGRPVGCAVVVQWLSIFLSPTQGTSQVVASFRQQAQA